MLSSEPTKNIRGFFCKRLFFLLFLPQTIKQTSTFMNKQRVYIERNLHSKSGNIIWKIISTEGGLSKWIADEVVEEDGKFRFMWGDPYGSHEVREAKIMEVVKGEYIKIMWEDETDPEAVIELRMTRNDITGDFVLHVTDWAEPDDVESLEDIWDQNFEQLHRTCGL